MNFNNGNLNNLEVLVENQTLTTSGSVQVTIDTSQYKEYWYTIRIDGPVTGISPTLQFTLFDQDLFGVSVTGNQTQSPVYTGSIVAQTFKHITETGLMQINWTVGGTTPSFGGVYIAITGLKDSMPVGQETMANSEPVVIASDQSAIPVTVASLPLPTGAATAANQVTQITSLQLLDDAVNAPNTPVNKGAPIMGELDDVATVVATENNVSIARITAQRALHTNLRNNAGTEIATSTNPLRTDPTGTTTQPVSGTVTANQGTTPWNENISQYGGVATTLGQKVSASSIPVVIASDQSITISGTNSVKYSDSPNLDAAARLRVSSPESIFDAQFLVDKSPLTWDESLTGAATSTFVANESSINMTCGTASGDQVIRQSKRYFAYHPGKSQLIFCTGVIGTQKANVRQRIGYFDSNNGLFFQQDNTNGKSVVQRSFVTGSAVDTIVAQASWNIDKMDGTGVSGITIDWTKANLFIIDFLWLGAARVRFGFIVNGVVYYCHQFLNSNSLTTVYMTNALLPVRYEITNTGVAATSTTLKQICCTVASEGGYSLEGIVRSVTTGVTSRTGSTTPFPLISIRKSSANNKIPISIENVDIFASTSDSVLIQIYINPTLTGASFTAAPGGIAQFDVSATSFTGGTLVYSTFLNAGGTAPSLADISNILNSDNLILGTTISGTSDIFTVSVTNFTGGGNVTLYGSINYREYL